MPRGTSISIRKTANARRRIARVLLRSVVTAALLPATLAAQDVESAADTTPPPPARRPARVCAGGDITLGTNLDTAWARAADRRVRQQFGITPDPMTLMTPLRQLFGDADLVLLNVETALGDGPVKESKCAPRSKNCYAFRGPAEGGFALRAIGDSAAVVVGNVANNHARDAGQDGFDSTAAILTRAGILVTGADTLATAVMLPDSASLAVIGFHTNDAATDARNLAAVRRHVARAVERFGTVIVTVHIGAEGVGAQRTRDTTELFLASKIDRGNPVAFATAAFDAGATLVVGHGPHVLRAAEWRDDRLVFYSLGNLATYGPFNIVEPLNRGVVACVDLIDRQILGAELRPTMQLAPGIVIRDSTRRALRLIDSLGVLDFPLTGARVDQWGDLQRNLPLVPVSRAPQN
jgi:poly-gamma-glutamate capsule biosynthesis protein CapA/YwtB (metallophosphatase superfamily)